MAWFFPRLLGGLWPPGQSDLVVRTGGSNDLAGSFQHFGACGVFFGEPEQAIAQIDVGTIPREALATRSLFTKIERLCHWTHSQPRRESLRALSHRRLRISASDVWSVSALCRVGDSIPCRSLGT